MTTTPRTQICSRIVGVVLAGGRATRLAGCDKALVALAGRPLLAHVLARLRPQVDAVAINSNAPASDYASFALPVIADTHSGFQGPLAGIHAGMQAYPLDCLLTVAVDLPFLPTDLVARLAPSLRAGRCAYASLDGNHTLAILWAPGLAKIVETALRANRHSLRDLLAELGDPVAFPPGRDGDLSFNINTPDALAAAELRMREEGS
jgi:molybdopterin-guanine dinucleotide biosynthesis protein A